MSERKAEVARKAELARNAWTAPGPIADDDAYKGTAAAHPVLVAAKPTQAAAPGRAPGSDPKAEAGARARARTPEQIEADLGRTRADLADTLDELSTQLSPRNLARRARKGVRARLVDPDSGGPRRSVLLAAGGAVAAVGGTVFALRVLRRRRD